MCSRIYPRLSQGVLRHVVLCFSLFTCPINFAQQITDTWNVDHAQDDHTGIGSTTYPVDAEMI